MKRITYTFDGVAFTFPYTTLRISETPVYSEDGITRQATRYAITVRGVIVGTNEQDFQLTVREMQCKLRTPRGSFLAESSPDGSTYYTVFEIGGGTDLGIDWGPHPGELSFDNFSSGRAANYTYSIDATSVECFESAGCGSPATTTTNPLSINREYDHSINSAGLTTRTVSGVLTVTAAEADAGRDADYWRWICIPDLPGNFERVSQDFKRNYNGTQLAFSIVDREVMWTLPPPISNGSANLTVRLAAFGARMYMTLSGDFEAPAHVGKDAILTHIGNLVLAKFPASPVEVIWETRQVAESVYDNRVTFTFTGYCAGLASQNTNWLLSFGGQPPDSNGIAQFIGPYGGDGTVVNSGVKANSPIKYDPCRKSSTSPQDNGSVGSGGGAEVPGFPLRNSDFTSGDPGDVTNEHLEAPFLAYHDKISWEYDNHYVFFSPKKIGAETVVQQTAMPELTIIQAGYLVRDGGIESRPTPPRPLFGREGKTFRLRHSFVEPSNPEPLAVAGQHRWTVAWRYVFTYQPALIGTDGPQDMIFPADPRTNDIDPNGVDMINLPHLVDIDLH